MNFPNHFLLYFITSTVASIIPSLAVMSIFSTSIKYGFKASVIMALGTSTANIIYFLLSALGLIIIFNEYKVLFFAIKYAGVAYLFYLGIQSFFSKESALTNSNKESLNTNKKSHIFYVSGIVINLTNPKNLLFFLAVLPQYINIKQHIATQFVWLTLALEVPAVIILSSYAYFAKKMQPMLSKEEMTKNFNLIVGFLFCATAMTLLVI